MTQFKHRVRVAKTGGTQVSRQRGKKEVARLRREIADRKRMAATVDEIGELTDRIKVIHDWVYEIAQASPDGEVYDNIKQYIPEFVGCVNRVQSLSRPFPEIKAVVDKAITEDGITIALLELHKLRGAVKHEVIRTLKINRGQKIRELNAPRPSEGSICIWVGCEHHATFFTSENVGYCKRHARTAGVTEPGKA